MILRILLLNALFLESIAFSSLPFQRTSTMPRTQQLYSFEVMAGVEAAQAVGVVGGSASATSSLTAPFMAAVNSFFQTQPYLAAFLTCSVKASAADMLAQSQEESDTTTEPVAVVSETKNAGLDFSRNLGFLMYGGLYSGMAQNYLYNVIYPHLFGADGSWQVIVEQVVADNLIFAPLLCLPIAYIFKSAFTSDELNMGTLKQGLEKYVGDVVNNGLLLKYWTLWIPVQFMTFGVIPAHFRVVFVGLVSFFWICILSTIAASETPEDSQKLALSKES